jgi:hypothetical protein
LVDNHLVALRTRGADTRAIRLLHFHTSASSRAVARAIGRLSTFRSRASGRTGARTSTSNGLLRRIRAARAMARAVWVLDPVHIRVSCYLGACLAHAGTIVVGIGLLVRIRAHACRANTCAVVVGIGLLDASRTSGARARARGRVLQQIDGVAIWAFAGTRSRVAGVKNGLGAVTRGTKGRRAAACAG